MVDFCMRFDSVPCCHNGISYELGSCFGSLRVVTASKACRIAMQPKRPRKVEEALALCNHPYNLRAVGTGQNTETTQQAAGSAPKSSRRLIQLCGAQFFLARMYAAWASPLFASAREATVFFRTNAAGDQSQLCLARALFAAKTSRRFRGEGVVLIGVFLPARSLHAWIIESGEIADPFDDIWINYRPVAILS